ncbi:hypothetical protein LG634_23320 [Streptomyces bambusae]|uniref:L,D-transpeptidase family protein n=1 Tax=Streptomyces bambusae TaxID=1550616 RepID=UPI001CFC71B4|nr:L,D-transpeptidase family protein [Streptomyces bambusae]MCB5167749.1 hypothetical protein [Streptomyces bambusae]
MRNRLRFTPVALATALAAGLLTAAVGPAQAGPATADAPAAVPAYYLKFDKSSVTNSRLYLMKSVAGPDRVLASYKAGSGQTTNTCTLNKGWLPNGTYNIEFHRTNFDGIINGYVIKISDKKCHNGTKRTELFIHSEMRPNGTQGTIESERWTNSNPNDYYSNGCIKLNPGNIKNLFSKIGGLGWSRVTKLYVVS